MHCPCKRFVLLVTLSAQTRPIFVFNVSSMSPRHILCRYPPDPPRTWRRSPVQRLDPFRRHDRCHTQHQDPQRTVQSLISGRFRGTKGRKDAPWCRTGKPGMRRPPPYPSSTVSLSLIFKFLRLDAPSRAVASKPDSPPYYISMYSILADMEKCGISTPHRRECEGGIRRQKTTCSISLCLLFLLVDPASVYSWQPRLCPTMKAKGARKQHLEPSQSAPREAFRHRGGALLQQAAAVSSVLFSLSSSVFLPPAPALAADDKIVAIEEARAKLEAELKEEKNIQRLETAIENADWETLKQVIRCWQVIGEDRG